MGVITSEALTLSVSTFERAAYLVIRDMIVEPGIRPGTRLAAMKLWPNSLPNADPAKLVRDLYAFENQNQIDPSGSQDMIGLLYPGINRLDYHAAVEGGVFPSHIESCTDPAIR